MNRVLISNCSAKKSDLQRGRCIDVYKGPWLSIIKKALTAGIEPVDVYIMSKKLGIIPQDQIINTYEHKADKEKDAWLVGDAWDFFEALSEEGHTEVYIGVMNSYQWILPDEGQLREWFPKLTIRPSMQLGHSFHHLQEWLYGRPMTEDVSKKNRLLVMGATIAPSQVFPTPAWDVYTTPSFKALRVVRDAGIEMPRILILTSSGPISAASPVIPTLHRAIKDGDAAAKSMALSTIKRMIEKLGAFDEVYLDKFPGVDYVFANPQQVFGEAKIVRSSGKASDLNSWLRGEPRVPSISKGRKSASRPWAQPLDKSVRPYILVGGYDPVDVTQRMEVAYREGYRLFKWSIQPVPDIDETAMYITALMTMPQACLF